MLRSTFRTLMHVEMPSRLLPFRRNPARELTQTQAGLQRVVANILKRFEEMFLIPHNSIITFFLPDLSGCSHRFVDRDCRANFHGLKQSFEWIPREFLGLHYQ